MPRDCPGKIKNLCLILLMQFPGATAAAGLAEESASPAVALCADFVFRNGAVYTLDERKPWARAVAVDEGRVVYVGDGAGATAWTCVSTRVIELGDGMLMPGFHDSHMHPMAAGTTYLRCSLEGLSWPDEVLAKVSECAARLEDGEWLRAANLDAALLAGRGPGTELLDGVTPGRAAVISDRYGQNVWLNSRALEAAIVDSSTPQPEGGTIERDPLTGEPTGVLRGEAVSLVWQLASRYSEKALREGLRLASRQANSFGITSANEASANAAHWSAYRAAEAAGEMTLRINASLRWDAEAGEEQLQAMLRMRDEARGPRFRADSVKFFLDGDIFGQTASLLQPVAAGGALGKSYFGERLGPLVTQVDAAGLNVHMHAYGDRAVREGLDAIAQAVAVNPPHERRHQIAHLALVDPHDMPRFAELGVTADIQPLWAWLSDDRRQECETLGPLSCSTLLAFGSLFDSGARVVAGSDWISESMNPLYGIQVAVTRRSPDGGGPPWNPDQQVSLERMLRAYTIDGAWVAGHEALTGSIEVGKAADLIVLERNLFTVDPMQLKDVKVLLTLLEGEIVYQNPGSEQKLIRGQVTN